jgi:hypothetical protein
VKEATQRRRQRQGKGRGGGVRVSYLLKKSVCYLTAALHPPPLAIITINKGGAVGTLKDGYIHNVPLPRVPQEQSASPTSIAPPSGIPLPGYLQLPSWIPMLPRIGSILGFSQRVL